MKHAVKHHKSRVKIPGKENVQPSVRLGKLDSRANDGPGDPVVAKREWRLLFGKGSLTDNVNSGESDTPLRMDGVLTDNTLSISENPGLDNTLVR